jgi:endoglucanase
VSFRLLTPAIRGVALALVAVGCSDIPTSPTAQVAGSATALVGADPLQVLSPSDGAWLTGEHIVSARLTDRATSQYRMFWQVDGGSLVLMANSADGSGKEAYIDYTGWRWNGSGPYAMNFVAKEKGRNVIIAQRAVWIYAGTRRNPFDGVRFYVDPWSNARQQADAWRATRPADATTMDKIAAQSQADWLGDWIPNIAQHVSARVSTITAAGALPVFVVYNIPVRDCNSYSAGGATSASAYRSWIRSIANAIGTRKTVVILEPDALGLLECLTPDQQQVRLDLLRDAVEVFKKAKVTVYIDAGNGNWQPASVMAARLARVRVAVADGFALNVSNFISTADNARYGDELSALLGGKSYLIDTSRNGLGPTSDYQWCNPDGRALGTPPTTVTDVAGVDAFLWVKRPGESDGTCNGGPSAGTWWAEYALGLALSAQTSTAIASAGG